MTEKSFVWDHSATGDAAYSPYIADEFNLFHFLPIVSNITNNAYVIPYYLDDLEVVTSGTSFYAVTVKTGAALLNNYLYLLDEAVTLTIDRPTAGYSRRDRVVLRFDQTTGNPQIRLDILTGTESLSFPSKPTLTQGLGVFEVSLADIYIDSYVASVLPTYIEDRRKFIYTAMAHLKLGGFNGNLLRNSEFLNFSYNGTVSKAPDEWLINGANPGTYNVSATYGSGRGNRSINLDDGTLTGGIRQLVAVGGSQVYTLAGSVSGTGNASYIVAWIQAYRKDGSLSSVIKYFSLKEADASSADLVPFQMTVKFPEDDIVLLDVYILATTAYARVTQPILVPGYFPGMTRPVNEIVMSTFGTPDTSWDGDAKSTATTTINLAASFTNVIKNYTKAVILRLRARDSGSAAAANCYLRALGYAAPFNGIYGSVELGGVTNDNWRETVAIVPVEQIYWNTGTGGAQFRLEVAATGAATLDARVEIVGIII